MTGDTVGARSLKRSAASIDASSITHTPAFAERWRPALRRTVWWLTVAGISITANDAAPAPAAPPLSLADLSRHRRRTRSDAAGDRRAGRLSRRHRMWRRREARGRLRPLRRAWSHGGAAAGMERGRSEPHPGAERSAGGPRGRDLPAALSPHGLRARRGQRAARPGPGRRLRHAAGAGRGSGLPVARLPRAPAALRTAARWPVRGLGLRAR